MSEREGERDRAAPENGEQNKVRGKRRDEVTKRERPKTTTKALEAINKMQTQIPAKGGGGVRQGFCFTFSTLARN